MTEEKPDRPEDSLFEAFRGLAESGALVIEEVIETIKPSDDECRRLKRRFWELQSKIAGGLGAIAEHRLRDLKTDASPRHADRIVVEED